MIARVWHGHTRAEDADAYGAFLETRGIGDYKSTPGNAGALLLKRVAETTAEFTLISFWESFEAIQRFSGKDVDKAVYYPEDEHFLLGKEPWVIHYDVAATAGVEPPKGLVELISR